MSKLLLIALVTTSIAACGDAGSRYGDLADRRGRPTGTAAGESPIPGDDDPTTGETTDSSSNELTGSGDAGTDSPAPPPPSDAFTGAPAFVAQTGPSTIKDDHGGNGDPTKQACLNAACHGAGGQGPRFLAGGSVFKDLAGTIPAAQIEVRLRDAAGNAVLARTDANGNFFVRSGGQTLGFPTNTAVRDATLARPMGGAIANGDCNSAGCHGAATTGPIHLP